MPVKRAVCLALAAACVFSGCQKKKKIEPATPEMPKLETTVKKDSDDIFNEFYDEDADATEKASSQKAGNMRRKSDFYSSSSTAEFLPGGRYVVQISCVTSKRFADKLAGECEAKGWPAYVAQVSNPTPDLMGTYYRVRIGGFNSISAARNFAESELVSAGYQYWIDNRSNDNVGMDGYGMGKSSVGEYGGSPGSTPAVSQWGSSSAASSARTSDSWSGSSSSGSWSSSTETTPAVKPAPPAEVNATPTPSAASPAGASSTPDNTGAARPAPTDDWGKGGEWGDDSGW